MNYSVVNSWEIPTKVWAASLEELSADGRQAVEGIALWLGTKASGIARVTHVALLRGPGIRRQRYLLEMEPCLFSELTDLACENGVMLLGQIHSHAPECRTEISDADRDYGITVPYYLSVIAPSFAQPCNIDPLACGIYVYDAGAGYQQLESDEVEQRIIIRDDLPMERFIVGTSR